VDGFLEIAEVDLSSMRGCHNDRKQLGIRLAEICHHVGFFVAKNHGVDAALIETVFEQSKSFFNLPLAQKQTIDKCHSRHFRGWESEGTEFTNGRTDVREQIDFWSEHPSRDENVSPQYLKLLGPNQWPQPSDLPDFESALNIWFEKMGALADELLVLLALGLDLPERSFEHLFGDERMSLTKLIRYPTTPIGSFGVNAHHDTGFLTLLAPGNVAGLQVENPDGKWVDVPHVPGALVVNLGEMLQAITSNFFVATAHRVVARQERYSIAYFHGPSLSTALNPIQLSSNRLDRVTSSNRHSHAGYMARREETAAGIQDMKSGYRADVYGEQLWNYFQRSYPDNVERHYPTPQ